MTRRIKDRTEWLAFISALLFSRLAVNPFHCFTTASGDRIGPSGILTIPVAAAAATAAVGLVYFVEARTTNDPCVRRHRFRDMRDIVGLMVLCESVSSIFPNSPWWMRLAVMVAGGAAISIVKSSPGLRDSL